MSRPASTETSRPRLIENRLPIAVINELAQREKIGHIAAHPRKLHLWWARRPLAAARAAVYAALVDAEDRDPKTDSEFFRELCRWEPPAEVLKRAREDILRANGGTPAKVLDMFAGGGAIPLEAARLGCDATAIELNPVAHLIERCTLEYPQRFPGLADDIRTWGQRWVNAAWEKLKDLYPPLGPASGQQSFLGGAGTERRPLAYLWTRTVRCPNPAMAEHRVPLVRQTWLARKTGRCIALRAKVDRAALAVGWEVVQSDTPAGLGFDPAAGSKRGDATCLICGASVDADYVKSEGLAGRMGTAPLAAVVLKESGRGRDYLPAGSYALPGDDACLALADKLDPPEEPLPVGDARNFWAPLYGLLRYRDLFTPRQLATLCTLAAGVRETHIEMLAAGMDEARAEAAATVLGLIADRIVDVNSTLTHWDNSGEKLSATYARQALPMVWDFGEINPWGASRGDVGDYVDNSSSIVESLESLRASRVIRGSATSLPVEEASQDAVVTDPPYYDNISYADLSDFFYVWLKRSIGELYPEDLGGELTPKRTEAIAAPYRHGGHKDEARAFYESLMAQSFAEAHRVLKPGAPLVCIYAHKTTFGWSTLVEALRSAGFTITEAWPLDTEMPERSVGQGTASLASSIFLVARKRADDAGTGSEAEVAAELDGIVRERLDALAQAGVSGSDLIIAAVGAGLKAFTRFERVEQANGERLPAERFLAIVQNRVLDAIFGNLAGADPATRFYVAGQFSYGYGWVPFGEALNLAYVTGVEIDGPRGLASGPAPLIAKKGSTVSLRDYEERGESPKLGIAEDGGLPSPVIDVAHGVLWRAEYRPAELKEYLAHSRPDAALLRSVMHALAGRALRTGSSDGKAREQAAAERLLGSWRHLVEENLLV